MSKNDEKILELKKIIEQRKQELGEKKPFAPVTSCSIDLDGTRYNIHTINDLGSLDFLLVKLHALEMSAKDLGVKINISGFPLEDWLTDLCAKGEALYRKQKEAELKALEKKLDTLLSADKRTELEIDSIADLLK